MLAAPRIKAWENFKNVATFTAAPFIMLQLFVRLQYHEIGFLKMEEISIREFGRRTGEVDTTIRRFKEKGILPPGCFGVHPKNGRPIVYYEEAYKYYAAFRGLDPTPPVFAIAEELEPAQEPEKVTAGDLVKESQKKNKKQSPEEKPTKTGAGAVKTPPDPDRLITSAMAAKYDLRKKAADAELQELKLEEQRGNLVSRATVTKTLYEFGSALRNQILSVPDRVIDSVYAAPDRGEAHRILSIELNDSLSRLSDIENLKLSNNVKKSTE